MIEKAMMLVKKYRKLYGIPEEVKIEVELIEQGEEELIFFQKENKAKLRLSKWVLNDINDISEYIAKIKLGIDYEPLLATMYFQKDLTEEEERLASHFYTLIIPIIDAWTWKTMSMYLPEEEMEKELQELKDLWEQLELEKMMTEAKTMKEIDRRRQSISMYLIFKVLGHDANLKLVGSEEHKKEWEEYIKDLEEIVMKTPSIEPLIELGKKYLNRDISVKEDGYRYVEIH